MQPTTTDMNFSSEWEQLYGMGRSGSVWPWSDLVSYVMRLCKNVDAPSFKVLELGCGGGANIPLFKSIGVQYFGIEGSQSIVDKLWARYPEHKNNIVQGDFTKEIPFDEKFDLVIDRASLTHNTTQAIEECIALVNAHIAPGGHFIGIDWFSTEHSDYKKGEAAEDVYTKTNITEGQFTGVGRVHFSDKAHIWDLFNAYDIKQMEHKMRKREIPADDHLFASWDFVAQKTA